jgi:uncharacterized membrane protein
MIANSKDLLEALGKRGFASQNGPNEEASPSATPTVDLASTSASDRPWYISAVLGISGWFAGLFALGFVGVLFLPNSSGSAALVGGVLLTAACGLYRADREGAFVAQLALALSIAGQCLMLFAMTEHTHGIAAIAWGALLLQTILALAMPNALHRMLSTIFAAIAWALVVRFGLVGEPDFMRGTHQVAVPLAKAVLAWLMAWLPIGAAIWMTIRNEPEWMARGWQPVVRPILNGAIVGLAFATVASQPFESFRWLGDDAYADGLSMWPLLSAAGAMGAMAAAFALRSRALIGACAVAVLLHVSHFYYELGASLLIKSLIMLAMGAVMLIAARMFDDRKAQSGAHA